MCLCALVYLATGAVEWSMIKVCLSAILIACAVSSTAKYCPDIVHKVMYSKAGAMLSNVCSLVALKRYGMASLVVASSYSPFLKYYYQLFGYWKNSACFCRLLLPSVSISLDPDLGPNRLQRLSADGTNR